MLLPSVRLAPNPARMWDKAQVVEFVKRAIGRVGSGGWEYLSPQMREALISQECLDIVVGGGRYDVPAQAAWQLRQDMRLLAGLS